MKTTLKRLLCLVLSVMFFTMSLPVLAADVADEPTTTATETKYPLENPDYKIYTKADLLEFAGAVKNAKGEKVTAQLFANIDLLKDISVQIKRNPRINTTPGSSYMDISKNSEYAGDKSLNGYKTYKTDVTETTEVTVIGVSYTFVSSEKSVTVYVTEKEATRTTTTTNVTFYKNNTQNSTTLDGKYDKTSPATESEYLTTPIAIATIDIATGDVTSVAGEEVRFNEFKEYATQWTPIGQSAAGENDGFCGVFDAFQYNDKGEIVGGYSISGIYINGGENEVGLFGHVGHAEIRGVKVENSYIRGNEKVGAIAGFAHQEASFVGCWNANTSVVSGDKNVGGIVGALDAEGGALQDKEEDHLDECVNRGHVHGKTNVGGILGYGYWAVIRGCFNVHDTTNPNAGLVHGENYVGGIVGLSDGAAIYACSNYADVEATGDYVGGIAGHLAGENAYLREVVNGATATVTGKDYVGGIAGSLGRTANGDTVVRELFMSYNHGTVNGNDYVGGLVGYNAESGKVFNSYSSGAVVVADKDTSSNGNIVGINDGIVRDCFYYPQKNTGTTNAIGNGVGSFSDTSREEHVSGLKEEALTSTAAAYLLNLVYLGEAEGEGTDVHEVGYHHMATHDFGDANWENRTYWMAGENGPEFTEDSKLAAKTITGAQLLLDKNFNLKFKVDVPAGLSDEVITNRTVVVYQNDNHLTNANGDDYTPERVDVDENNFYYQFTLTGIEPHFLGDTFEVVFTADYAIPEWNEETKTWESKTENAIKVSERVEYSVLDYCTRQLNRTKEELGYTTDEDYQKFVTLLCNVLEYGAQYQKYRYAQEDNGELETSKLVSEKVKEALKKLNKAGVYAPVDYWNADGIDANDKSIKPTATVKYELLADTRRTDFYARSTLVRIGSENAMGLFFYIENCEDYKNNGNPVILKVEYASGDMKEYRISDLEAHGTLPNVYKFAGDPVSIVNYRNHSVFTVYAPVEDNGTWAKGSEYERITYNMESFIVSLLNLEITDARVALARELWDYAYAATQFVKPTGGNSGGTTAPDITLDTDNIFDPDIWEDIKQESGEHEDPKEDTDNDGVPDSWVKLNISDILARIISIFNPILRGIIGFEIVEYQDAWYARPYGPDWSEWDAKA